MAIWSRSRRSSEDDEPTPDGATAEAASATSGSSSETPETDGTEETTEAPTETSDETPDETSGPTPRRRFRRAPRLASARPNAELGDSATPTTQPATQPTQTPEPERTAVLVGGPADREVGQESTSDSSVSNGGPGTAIRASTVSRTGTGSASPREINPGSRRDRMRLSVLDSTPVTLLQAAHIKQALVTAAALMVAAAASGRDTREVLVVLATVLVGQIVLGWHNDLVDRERDARHATPGKPLAEGRLDVETTWYAVVIGLLILLPLSLTTGVTGGVYYLVSILIGILGNVALRTGRFSWVPWAASFAMYPFYLSYGGWGGDAAVAPPQVAMVVLAALLGVGVHVVRSLWGLVPDDEDGWTYLPLALGRRLGSSRLLVLGVVWCAAVVALIVVVGLTAGLRQ